MPKLREFMDERFHWEGMEECIRDNEMITEAVVILRILKVDESNAHGEMPERTQLFMSVGCGIIMTKGMLVDTEERIAFDHALDYSVDEGDDDNGST